MCYTVEPLYNGHLWGTKFWPLYRGGLCRGVVLYTNSSVGTRVPGRYIAVGLSSGVAVKRGSTVVLQYVLRCSSLDIFESIDIFNDNNLGRHNCEQ